MKKLWARMGMSVNVTDEEHTTITKLFADGKEDEAAGMLWQIFMHRGYLYGDSYMPGNYCSGCEDNPNDEEFTLM